MAKTSYLNIYFMHILQKMHKNDDLWHQWQCCFATNSLFRKRGAM